jgi:16S rRNA (cytosine967-C5)-methyltransferase
VEDGLWRVLQIGVTQIVLIEGVAEHAALHATAELTKQLNQPQWTGLVNGVLRAILTALDEDVKSAAATNAIPIGGDRFRTVDRALFADPQLNPAEYLSKAYSYPRWLIRNWLSRWDVAETTRICRWFNAPAAPTVRVNALRATATVLSDALRAAGVNTAAGRFPESLLARKSFRPLDLPGFDEGWFSIQDESAMSAARLLAPQPGETVLDLCAAPGGKTTHLAELMQDKGRIVAADSAADRLQLVDQSAHRLGLNSIETCAISRCGDGLPDGPFDAALVDVPCSNTGVLGKRPEARWRLSADSVAELVPIQSRLLGQAIDRMRAGGRLVYSTCSIDSRENRGVVDGILSQRSGVSLERECDHTPGLPGDGGYQAVLHIATGGS